METSTVQAGYLRRAWPVLAAVALVAIALAALVWMRQGLLILFASILFAVFLTHLAMLIARWTGFRYGLALGILVVLLIVLGAGLIIFMGSRIAMEVGQFAEQFQAAREAFLQRWQSSEWPQWLGSAAPGSQRGSLGERALTTAQSAVTTTLRALGSVLFVLVTGFYFALQAGTYRAAFLKLFPVRVRRRTDEVIRKMAMTLWWWILGRLAGMVLIGVGSTLGLWLLNIPLAVVLGVLAGLLNFIPNLGPLIAAIPPMLFALQQGPTAVWSVAGFYLLLQFVESYFITPLIDQHQVHLPPGLVLSAQLLMGLLAGVTGLLLATPVAVVLFVFVREVYVTDLLGDPAPLRRR